jgi:excisionase family DNA binding protein
MVSGRYDTEGDVMSVTTRKPEWLNLKAYELVATGELPAVRIGRCIRINRRELDEWLHRQRYLNVAK